MESGGPPRVPQITFATSSQPVGPESAGQKRLGASELGPTVPRTAAPRPSPRRYILPHRPPPLVEAEQRPRCSAEARCSEPGVAAGRSPWLGVWGGTPGAEEDGRGRGVMRRGGTLPSPRPRALAAARQAPPFLLSEEQVFHAVSRDLKDRGFWEVPGLPGKEGNLWKKGERRQALPRDQQDLRSCGKLKDTSQRRGKKPQPQTHAAFGKN